jgi:predicted site-specific integrase-resolvase
MFDENVIRFATAQEKRRAVAFARLSGADARQKILAATIEAFRRSGWSNEEIVKMLRFAIEVLEGREN